MTTPRIDIAFEEEVLARSLRDPNYLKRASRVLDEHHFGTKAHGYIWKVMRSTWDTYREPATPKIILARVRADFRDDEKRAPVLELARRLFKIKPESSAAALDELATFVRHVNAQVALEKAATDLERGRLDDVYAGLRGVSQRDLRPREYTHISWIEDFPKRQAERKHRREHPEEYTSIPTGIKRLDRVITGLQLGEVGLVMGTTGRGKSIMLTNFAYNAVRCGYPTAYFGFEMPARQIAMRQDARWLQIAYNKFREYNFTPSELAYIRMRLKKMRRRFRDKLEIFSMPVRSADVNTIRAALDDVRLEKGFKPQLVILDSPDHLNPMGKAESLRVDQTNVYWEVKGMAESEGYAIWASTHAGRDFESKIATAESAAESYDKARIADLIFSLNEPKKHSRATKVVDDDEEEDDEDAKEVPLAVGRYMEGYLAKYRDGASKFSIPLDAQLEKMLIMEAGLDDEKEAS